MIGRLLAGAASADITPNWALANYNGQLLHPSQEPNPLLANVLVCRDSSTCVALVSIDCTFADRALVLRIRDQLQRSIGVEPGNVVVATTHNHTTPATAASFLSGALPNPLYLDLLATRLAVAAQKAAGGAQPAVLAASILPAPPIAHCRRRISPSGQSYMMPDAGADSLWPAESDVDREMTYLAFESLDGQPIAVVLNFAMHNNITFGLDRYHGDIFGRVGRIIQEGLGHSCPVLTLAAPSGDVCWCGPDLKPAVAGENADERSWSAGRAIAAPLLAAYPGSVRHSVEKIVVCSRIERLPDRSYADSDFCHDGCRGADETVLKKIRRRYDPEEEAVKRLGDTWCDVELQCVAFGPAAIVTNPAELFSTYGMAIKSRSPFPVTVVSELTNGYCGYVPTKEAFQHKGYETHRTVYTSRLAKDAGEKITATSASLLSEAWRHYESNRPA